jgi:hypothetical protein
MYVSGATRNRSASDALFVYCLFVGPNCRWASDEIDENVCVAQDRQYVPSDVQELTLLVGVADRGDAIGLSHSDVKSCLRLLLFFYFCDSSCATASRMRRRNTWEMEREKVHMP